MPPAAERPPRRDEPTGGGRPRILIEYDVVKPTTSQGGHVHAIPRDPTNDYGTDWLGLHYQEQNPIPGGTGGPGGPPPGGGPPAP